jgi:hypothetical protein
VWFLVGFWQQPWFFRQKNTQSNPKLRGEVREAWPVFDLLRLHQ